MIKKIIVGSLMVIVLGAGVAGTIYAVSKEPIDDVIASGEMPLAGDTAGGTSSSALVSTNGTPQVQAQNTMGVPWVKSGKVLSLDPTGMNFVTSDNEEVYVELGPEEYYQAQEYILEPEMVVTVEGMINDDGMIHAYQVEFSNGYLLQLRTTEGQPMWSGGFSNENGQNGDGLNNGTPNPQAQVDEWLTYEGQLISFQGGKMTIATADGQLLAFQTGQPSFFAGQGVTFEVGDSIKIVGFYENETNFSAGEVVKLTTGERVMLRDPNGRPLWAGPGGNGNGKGNGGN